MSNKPPQGTLGNQTKKEVQAPEKPTVKVGYSVEVTDLDDGAGASGEAAYPRAGGAK
jgi:hypothetical protein